MIIWGLPIFVYHPLREKTKLVSRAPKPFSLSIPDNDVFNIEKVKLQVPPCKNSWNPSFRILDNEIKSNFHKTIYMQIKEVSEIRAAVYFRGTSEDTYVQAVTGLIIDMLDRARQLSPPILNYTMRKVCSSFNWYL